MIEQFPTTLVIILLAIIVIVGGAIAVLTARNLVRCRCGVLLDSREVRRHIEVHRELLEQNQK